MARRKKVNIFVELKEALEDALAYERGEAVDLRVTQTAMPPIKKLRNEFTRKLATTNVRKRA